MFLNMTISSIRVRGQPIKSVTDHIDIHQCINDVGSAGKLRGPVVDVQVMRNRIRESPEGDHWASKIQDDDDSNCDSNQGNSDDGYQDSHFAPFAFIQINIIWGRSEEPFILTCLSLIFDN